MALRVSCCTWNVHGISPPNEDLRQLLHLHEDKPLPDIVAVGLQEAETKPHLFIVEIVQENRWVQILQDYLGYYGLVRVRSLRMMGMIVLVAVQTKHLPYLEEIKTGFARTAVGGWLGTKGAVAIRFMLHKRTFCFINCHFAAHMDAIKQRNSNFESVLKYVTFPDVNVSRVLEHDVVLLFGDLNYRIDEIPVEEVKKLVSSNELAPLKEHDQLMKSRTTEEVFQGFLEQQFEFPPTYKFTLGTNDWDGDQKRKPAWCDRILWKEASQGSVTPVTYTSHPRYLASDHKPVSGEYIVDVGTFVQDQEKRIAFKLEIESMPWYGNDDGLCVYVVKDYKPYSWDWIGLYRLGWQHFTDYEMYEWAVGDGDEYGENGCAVLFDCLPEEPGLFQLCYFSYKQNCFIAMSEIFEILKPRDEDVDPVEVNIEKPSLNV